MTETADNRGRQRVNFFEKTGGTGLKNYGGFINEKELAALDGQKGITMYAEMRDNSPVVGAFKWLVETLATQAEWYVEGASNDPIDEEARSFLESCLHDMDESLSDLLTEILSMVEFGWAAHEIILKVRDGENSRYNDGRIGIKALPIRAQETLQRFILGKDENGNDDPDVIAGIEQILPTGGNKHIPIEKLLLFRTRSFKGNPLGRSLLRNAYRPYYYVKRIQEIESIGVERDANGIPVVKAPIEIFLSTASDDQKATLSGLNDLAKNIKANEAGGVVFPVMHDKEGNLLYDLQLLSASGQKQFDTDKIISRYQREIALSLLSDFLFLGQQSVGSFALSSDKTAMFSTALGGLLDRICETINRKLVPLLMKLNGFPTDRTPVLKHGDIEDQDLSIVGQFINNMVAGGIIMPDPNLENYVRRLARLPEADKIAGEVGSGGGNDMAADALDAEADKVTEGAQNAVNTEG